ncbi:MAG: response regulator [Gemmatimonadales bacterium]
MVDLTAVVVDDEPIIRRDLIRMLGGIPGVRVVAEAGHGLDALERIEEHSPDVVFLDVQMPELDGLGVVAALDPGTAPLIVFVTAYDRYAITAFDVQAADYLLKPFDRARLVQTMERVHRRHAANRALEHQRVTEALQARRGPGHYLEQIAARGPKHISIVPAEAIEWIEAADNYVRLHTADGRHLSRRTMKDLEQLLDPAKFARIHRSSIVRITAVRELRPLGDGDYEVRLESGALLLLSRTYRAAVAHRFGGIS